MRKAGPVARALSRMRVGEGRLRTGLLRVEVGLRFALLPLGLWVLLSQWLEPSQYHRHVWIYAAVVAVSFARVIILHITELEPPKSEPKPLLNLSA